MVFMSHSILYSRHKGHLTRGCLQTGSGNLREMVKTRQKAGFEIRDGSGQVGISDRVATRAGGVSFI